MKAEPRALSGPQGRGCCQTPGEAHLQVAQSRTQLPRGSFGSSGEGEKHQPRPSCRHRAARCVRAAADGTQCGALLGAGQGGHRRGPGRALPAPSSSTSSWAGLMGGSPSSFSLVSPPSPCAFWAWHQMPQAKGKPRCAGEVRAGSELPHHGTRCHGDCTPQTSKGVDTWLSRGDRPTHAGGDGTQQD